MGQRCTLLVLVLATLAFSAPSTELDKLKRELRDFDLKTRLAAIAKLEALGAAAAGALLPALGDEDWEVQIRTLEALGRLAAPETAEALARAAVEGEIIRVREAAVRALAAMDIPDVAKRILRGAAAAKKPEVKVRALDAAGALAVPGLAEELFPFLMNRETPVRAAACRALGATKDPAALPYLSKLSRDKDVAVVGATIGALGSIGGAGAMESLVEAALAAEDPWFFERIARAFRTAGAALAAPVLAEKAAAERKADRRAKLVRVLGGLEDPAAGPSLARFLADPDPVVRAWAARGSGRAAHAAAAGDLDRLLEADPDGTVRRMALEARVLLAKDAEGRAAVIVKALENQTPEIRIRAAVLAGRERCLAAVPALARMTAAADWRESTAALISVGILGHAGEVEIVAKRRADADWRVRGAALEALGMLRHMDVVPHLIEGLADRDPIVKSAALKNLQVLSQSSRGPDAGEWGRWYEENRGKLDITKKGYREEIPDDYYGKSKYLIEILNKAQIVCVLGKWDHAETVLEHLSIRATVVRPQELLTIGLNPKQLVLVNCEGSVGKKEALDALQWFVHVGGYLMTTDWALQNCLVRAFPGFIDREQSAKTGNDVVEIEAADPDHPLLRGVFDRSARLMWWLEVIAYPMKVIDPFRTDILVDSLQMLERRYGSTTLAAAFDYGHGMVEHCVSHFFLQEEGLTSRTTARDRKIFAADHLGISLDQIRMLEARGFFDGAITEAMTKEIAEDYSMFKLIVNFVVEKRRQVEQD